MCFLGASIGDPISGRFLLPKHELLKFQAGFSAIKDGELTPSRQKKNKFFCFALDFS
jgi:hypothetical protein